MSKLASYRESLRREGLGLGRGEPRSVAHVVGQVALTFLLTLAFLLMAQARFRTGHRAGSQRRVRLCAAGGRTLLRGAHGSDAGIVGIVVLGLGGALGSCHLFGFACSHSGPPGFQETHLHLHGPQLLDIGGTETVVDGAALAIVLDGAVGAQFLWRPAAETYRSTSCRLALARRLSSRCARLMRRLSSETGTQPYWRRVASTRRSRETRRRRFRFRLVNRCRCVVAFRARRWL